MALTHQVFSKYPVQAEAGELNPKEMVMKQNKKKMEKAGESTKKKKTLKVEDLSPKKNPKGGDRPPNYPDGGHSADE